MLFCGGPLCLQPRTKKGGLPVRGGMSELSTRQAEDLVSRLRKHSVLREASASVVNALPAGATAGECCLTYCSGLLLRHSRRCKGSAATDTSYVV